MSNEAYVIIKQNEYMRKFRGAGALDPKTARPLAELGVRLQAFATPLFVYMTPQGDKIMQIPGFKTVQDFRDYDRYVRGGHYRQKTLLEFLGGKS